MSIKEFIEKSKGFIEKDRDIFIAIIIVLVAFGSFGLGRLSKAEELKTPISIKNMNASVLEAKTESKLSSNSNKEHLSTSPQAGGFYVGSKKGSKYHFPWCGGAKRIKEGNKVIFDTIEQAREAGYTPAGNCKGLQ